MHTIWRLFSRFCRGIWQLLTFTRELILNLFILLLIVGIWLAYSQSTPSPSSPTQGALLVNLTGIVVDNPNPDNMLSQFGRDLFGSNGSRLVENSLFDLVDTLSQAKDDPNITGIVLSLDNFVGADLPSLQYIGKALREFRASGKPIYATGSSYSQSQYYLASFANRIYMAPQGAVNIHGMATNNLYYKSLLDKLDVSTHIFRVGVYKSAVEPFIRDNMSPEAREAEQRWVNSLWNNYLLTVSGNRQITPQQLYPQPDALIASLKMTQGNLSQYALKNRLVDQLASSAEVEQLLTKTFGWNKKEQRFNSVTLNDYQVKPSPAELGNSKIAVIFVNGTIIDGDQTDGMVGGDTTAAEIRQARLDDKVKAVILRVNSPGGSVTASETIRSELVALRKAGKPLVVSMGGMAASGGYWISTPANYIIASPTTITGSIGIFGVVNTFENTLDRIGVHTDGVATSSLAGINETQALTPEFKQLMQMSIESGYQRFLSIVSESRKKTTAQVNEIAQGHVWSGSDARKNGLVDQLGDFDDAVIQAAKLAKLEVYDLDWYTRQPTLTDLLLGQLTGSAQAVLPENLLKAWLPQPLREVSRSLQSHLGLNEVLNDPQHRYALCLTCSSPLSP